MIDNEDGVDGSFENTEIVLPEFKSWKSKQFYDFEGQIYDYENLHQLNATINQARKALFLVTDQINKYDRQQSTAKLVYDREHRRKLLLSTAKTASERQARADLQCEDLENEYLFNQQIKDELIRYSNSLRLELQTLQALGNNIRQQIKDTQ